MFDNIRQAPLRFSARRAAAIRTRRSRAIVTLAVGRSLIWRYSVMKPAASHARSLGRWTTPRA